MLSVKLHRSTARDYPSAADNPSASNRESERLSVPTIMRTGDGASLTRHGVMKIPSVSARLGCRSFRELVRGLSPSERNGAQPPTHHAPIGSQSAGVVGARSPTQRRNGGETSRNGCLPESVGAPAHHPSVSLEHAAVSEAGRYLQDRLATGDWIRCCAAGVEGVRVVGNGGSTAAGIA